MQTFARLNIFQTKPLTANDFVGEVWLHWTEDPKDADAARLRQKQLALVEALRVHFAAAPPGREEALGLLQNLNLARNDAAMRLLKAGINGGKVKYLQAGAALENPAGIAGLSVRILGPPRDKAALARMDPPAGDRYLRLAGNAKVAANAVAPFTAWREDRAKRPAKLVLDRSEEKEFREETERLDSLAFTIDQAINNTSIVALMTYRGSACCSRAMPNMGAGRRDSTIPTRRRSCPRYRSSRSPIMVVSMQLPGGRSRR